ncbi:MAG: hypothetical protein ACREIG_00345 [Nitrospiraceae bacterium]
MASRVSNTKQPSQRPVGIDHTFWKNLEHLLIAMVNLADRSSPPSIHAIPGWHPFLMVATRATKFIYGSISYLSADSPKDPLRKLEFGICTAPLIRSLVDLVYTILFIREKPRSRIKRFSRAGWRETKEMVLTLEKQYGSNRKWKPKLVRLNEGLEDLRIAYRISTRAARHPETLPKWPIPSVILREEKLRPKTRRFMQYLMLWYRELSQEHHMSGGGIIRVYGKLLLESTDADRDRIIREMKTSNVLFAVVCVLAVATEINDIGGFDRRQTLAYLWNILTQNRIDARELFTRRYLAMLRRAN